MSASASKRELIRLIYRHLKEHGFHSPADELQRLSPQGESKISTSLLDIYKSWLNDSKKKRQPDAPKHSSSKGKERTPAKASKLPTQTVSNQTPADDDSSSQLSQSLLLQIKTPKKKSSIKSKHEAPAATLTTASPVGKPKKKKDKPVKQTEAQKKKSIPAKSKSAKKAIKTKISNTHIKEEVASADGGAHSDSDSSLDVEKWKQRVLQMTEDDIVKMDTINALDSSAPQPKKKRVRKPRAKAPAKSNTPVQQTNDIDEKNEKREEKMETATPAKISKKSSPKKTVTSTTRLSHEQNTAEDRPATSTASPLKQTPVKGKRKPVTPSKENTDETTSEPKKKKKKGASEGKPIETGEDITEKHSKEEKVKNEVTEQAVCDKPIEEKKKTKGPKGNSNETEEMMALNKNGTAGNKNLSELMVQGRKAEKKKREKADNVENFEEVVEEVKVKKKKKKKAESAENSGQNVEEERENSEQVQQSEAKQNVKQVVGEKKVKKRDDNEEMSEQKVEETEQNVEKKKAKKKKKEMDNNEEDSEPIVKEKKTKKKKKMKENSELIIEEKKKNDEAEYNEDMSEPTVEVNENGQKPESSDIEEKPDQHMEGKKKKKKGLKNNSVDAELPPTPNPETPGPPKGKKKKKIKLKSPENLQFLFQSP